MMQINVQVRLLVKNWKRFCVFCIIVCIRVVPESETETVIWESTNNVMETDVLSIRSWSLFRKRRLSPRLTAVIFLQIDSCHSGWPQDKNAHSDPFVGWTDTDTDNSIFGHLLDMVCWSATTRKYSEDTIDTWTFQNGHSLGCFKVSTLLKESYGFHIEKWKSEYDKNTLFQL